MIRSFFLLLLAAGLGAEKNVFLTFSGGKLRGIESRVGSEAYSCGVFSAVLAWNESVLTEHAPFWSRHGDFVTRNSRGFGYWLWKPYLIQEVLGKMHPSDVLVYADSGSTVNCGSAAARRRLDEYLAMVRASPYGLLAMQMPGSREAIWTKADVSVALGATQDQLESPQFLGTILILRHTPFSKAGADPDVAPFAAGRTGIEIMLPALNTRAGPDGPLVHARQQLHADRRLALCGAERPGIQGPPA